jgi:hypothetical protein
MTLALALALAWTPTAHAVEGWGLPVADYSSETGLGLGGMGGLGWTGDAVSAADLELYLYASTGGEQDHSVWFSMEDLGGRPLSTSLWGGYASSRFDLYCGRPSEQTCMSGSLLEARTDQFQFAHTEGYGGVLVLWGLDEGASPWSVVGGWSGALYRAGVPRQPQPSPGTLYAARFPQGEEGMFSVLQGGLQFDTRDDEAMPMRGAWVDATVRGGARYWGSDWGFVGGNLTARLYVPLASEHLVSATRTGVDLVSGAQPTATLPETGGVQSYSAPGGAELGRGISAGRFRGQAKGVGQQELRSTFLSFELFEETATVGAVAFVDGGWVAHSLEDLQDSAAVWSTGAGLRLGWDDFILRADVGVSPAEQWYPFFYVDFDHVF